jgi:hypothetical protein
MSGGNTNDIQVEGVTCSFLYPFITHRNKKNCNPLNAKEEFDWGKSSDVPKEKFGRLEDFLAIHDNGNVPAQQNQKITTKTIFAISMGWGWWECIKKFNKAVSLDEIKQQIKDNLGNTNQSDAMPFSKWIDNFLKSKQKNDFFPPLPIIIKEKNKEEGTSSQTTTATIEPLKTKLIRYGISDKNQSLPEPFVIITGSVSNSTNLEIIKKNDCFELLMYRRPSDCKNKEKKDKNQNQNQDKNKHEHEHKNHAFGDKWICYFGPRVLFMLRKDDNDKQRIKELMRETYQAIAFIYTLTAELRLINNELDMLLNENLAELTRLYDQKNNKREILKTFLDKLVALRQRHVRTLSDPVFYAFPPGTIHTIIKKAREDFLTDIAEKRLQTKFDNIDRLIDDSLQVGALA